MLNEGHYCLKLVLTIDNPLLHHLESLCYELKLVNHFVQRLLDLWLQLLVSDTGYDFLGWELLRLCLTGRIVKDVCLIKV